MQTDLLDIDPFELVADEMPFTFDVSAQQAKRLVRAKYDPHQLRDPGGENGGQWAKAPGGGANLAGILHGAKVFDADQYQEAYGDVVDERSLDIDEDGTKLTARFFELGDAHLVVDLPGDRFQVIGEFDSDGMRALADGIREVQHERIPDDAPSGELVADHNSHDHPFYVAKDDVGDVRIRDDEAAEDDYLELGEDEAWELFDALNDLADSFDAEFNPEEEEEDDESVSASAATRTRLVTAHLKGLHDQRDHGRKGKKLVPSIDAPAAPKVKPAPAAKKSAPKKRAPAKKAAPEATSDSGTDRPAKPEPKPRKAPTKRAEPKAAPAKEQGPAALSVPPRNLTAMTEAGDPRAEALWYRAGDNSKETGSGRPGSFEMAAQLRGSEKMTPEMKKRVKDIDSVMAESKLPEAILVYRGAEKLGGVRPDEAIGEGRNLVGREFRDKSFASTSADAAHASWFGGTVLRIRVPAGTPAITMADRKGTDRDSKESEILLDRGLTYRVVAQYGRGEIKGDWGGAYVLDVEVVL